MPRFFSLLFGLLAIGQLAACDPVLHSNDGESAKLLDIDWGDGLEVFMPREEGQPFTVSNCDELVAALPGQPETVRPYEYAALNGYIARCSAQQLLRHALPGSESNLPSQVVNSSSPSFLPKEVALIVAPEEYTRIMGDPALKTWGQAHSVESVEEISPFKAHYVSSTGEEQTLQELGRGDVNHDGLEDVLLLSLDSLTGGSFRNVRLLILTVGADGAWRLLPNSPSQ